MENISGIDYSRQAQFNDAMTGVSNDTRHVIIGCGGIGFWLGVMLAMQGIDKLMLIDGDRIESSNLNRLPVPVAWKGVNKTIALRKVIKFLRPECVVSVIPSKISGDLLVDVIKNISRYEIQLWDCTDHMPTQQSLFALTKVHGNIQYRKIGYEGFEIGTYVDYSVWATTDVQATQGYRTASANAVSSVMSACLGMLAQGMYETRDVNLNLKEVVQHGVHTTRRTLCPNGQQTTDVI